MENLIIEQTKFTPKIEFYFNKCELNIKGESYPENTVEFYKPVFKWVKDYFNLNDQSKMTVNVAMYYFNSSSSKALMNLFEKLDNSAKEGHHITVNWLYDPEDEDSLEFGEEFAEDLDYLTFNLLPESDTAGSG